MKPNGEGNCECPEGKRHNVFNWKDEQDYQCIDCEVNHTACTTLDDNTE